MARLFSLDCQLYIDAMRTLCAPNHNKHITWLWTSHPVAVRSSEVPIAAVEAFTILLRVLLYGQILC